MKLSLAGRLVQAWKGGSGVRLHPGEILALLERYTDLRGQGLEEVKQQRAEREARAAAEGAHENHAAAADAEIW